jgi:hypothetical protein
VNAGCPMTFICFRAVVLSMATTNAGTATCTVRSYTYSMIPLLRTVYDNNLAIPHARSQAYTPNHLTTKAPERTYAPEQEDARRVQIPHVPNPFVFKHAGMVATTLNNNLTSQMPPYASIIPTTSEFSATIQIILSFAFVVRTQYTKVADTTSLRTRLSVRHRQSSSIYKIRA